MSDQQYNKGKTRGLIYALIILMVLAPLRLVNAEPVESSHCDSAESGAAMTATSITQFAEPALNDHALNDYAVDECCCCEVVSCASDCSMGTSVSLLFVTTSVNPTPGVTSVVTDSDYNLTARTLAPPSRPPLSYA